MTASWPLALALLGAPSARATISSGTADVVLGQTNFNNSQTGFIDGTGMSSPDAVAIDTVNGRAFAADTNNNRVLVWNSLSGLMNGQGADVVLGQPDFNSSAGNQGSAAAGANTLAGPQGVAVDGSGNLWVADSGNSRVLLFPRPFTTDMSATLVLGAAALGSAVPMSARERIGPAAKRGPPPRPAARRAALLAGKKPPARPLQPVSPVGPGGPPPTISPGPATSSTTLNAPLAVAFDAAGNMWVADSAANRVVHYTAPFATGMAADIALGQPDLMSSNDNQTSTTTAAAYTLAEPAGVSVDPSGRVWVADLGNNRLLGYSSPFVTDSSAAVVLGEPDFVTVGLGGASSATFAPSGVLADPSGNLWISDTNNARVLEFAAPISSGMSASLVLGQPDFTSSGPPPNVSTNTLANPQRLAMDASGALWVADPGDNRVLRFPGPISDDENANLVLGEVGFTQASYTNGVGMIAPQGIAVDSVNGRLFVADQGNGRVLWWNRISGFTNGEPADGALGQPDLHSTGENQNQNSPEPNTLCNPWGLWVDSSGALWVVDACNNRVLRFPSPPTTGMSANLVLGQPNFSSGQGNQGLATAAANSLSLPAGVVVDGTGHVWVADEGNNRVVHYSPPLSNGMSADLVLGQPNLLSAVSVAASASSLSYPSDVALDASGNVWVSDGNSRVLRYSSPISTGMNASLVLGQPNLNSGSYPPAPTAAGLAADGIAFDPAGNLWAVDTGYDRVVAFAPPFSNGMNAGLVLGQPNLTSAPNNTPTASSFQEPVFLTLDALGNVWVVDAAANRALEFQSSGSTPTIVASTPTVVNLSAPAAQFSLSIPGGAFLQSLLFSLTTPTQLPGLDQKNLRPTATPIAVEILNNLGLQPSPGTPLTITVTYSPSAVAGSNPDELVLAYFTPPNGPWVTVPSVDDPANRTVTGTLSHLSTYELFQSVPQQGPSDTLSNVHVYPNPYKPGSGGPYDNSSLGAGVVFEGLAPNSRIRVFTLSGEGVADFSTSAGNGKALWNIRNKSGNTVATGVYIFLVTNLDDTSQRATGRFAIVK